MEDRTRERLGTKDEKSKLAEDLYISEDTVKSYISNIYRKLKVHSRIELAHRVLGE